MFDINKYRLPKIYTRNSKECYLDPIRKKLIYVTPEETIRQKTISFIREELLTPNDMIVVEQHISHYGVQSTKRADIVIHGRCKDDFDEPIAVIECKAPEVSLDDKSINQVLNYCDLIGADYAMLTNGYDVICYKYSAEKNEYFMIDKLPKYDEMLSGKYIKTEFEPIPERIPFDKLAEHLKKEFASYGDGFYGFDISCMTPMKLAVPMLNFCECLYDNRVKMPSGNYGLFKLIQDYGVRILSYGNASGGNFSGPYRSFLIDVNGSTEFYSIGMTTYATYNKPDDVKTCICVAHDDEKESHHALQLVADDNIMVHDNMVEFYHHGRIAVGNKGSGKIDELRALVKKRNPNLTEGGKFYLGTIKNNRLWTMDDPELINIIVNLISYSMIRDEYREIVKAR